MKCISLTQPWATLVVIGAKKIETRGWSGLPKHVGPLAIQSSKSFPVACRELCDHEPFRSALAAAGIARWQDLPLGCLLGTVRMVRAYRFLATDAPPPEPERSFGDFTPGRIGVEMVDPIRFPDPVPQQGSLGLFDVPDGKIEAALAAGVGMLAVEDERRGC